MTFIRAYLKFNTPGFDMVLDIPEKQWKELTRTISMGEPLTSETVDNEILEEILYDEDQVDLMSSLTKEEINKLPKIDIQFI